MNARPRRRRDARSRAMARALELSVAAPAIVATRTSRMLAAGLSPTAADRREMWRMGAEKTQAFGDSAVAMALAMQRAWIEAWFKALQPWWTWPALRYDPRSGMRDVERAWHAVIDGGLAPIHRTAMANARRLGRARRR